MLAVAGLALVAFPGPARSQVDADRLPAATSISRVTWTRSPGLTRLEFHGASLVPPDAAMPSDRVLRIDFTAADASAVPARLDVSTEEVASLVRIPSIPGLLPEGVSARFLVMLAQGGLSWSTEPSPDELTVFIGAEEKAGGLRVALGESYYAQASLASAAMLAAAEGAAAEAATAEELLPRNIAFVVQAAQPVRATPSAVAAEIGWARAGETKLADARRGDWVHLAGGGWLRLPEVTEQPSAGGAPPRASAPRGRTPAAWSVVTLGTGLQADVEEVLPGDPAGDAVARLFRRSVRLARLTLRVQGGQFAYQLPPKKGRVQVTLADGTEIDSLDPRELDLVDEKDRKRMEEIFDAPSLASGDAWQTVLTFPGDLDFLEVEKMRLDVGGMRHGLFRVPGSGDRIPEDVGGP